MKKKNNYSGNAFTLIECLFSIFICNLSIFIFIFSYRLVSQSIVKNCFGDELGKIEFNEKIRIVKFIVSTDINDYKNNVVFQYFHPDLIENPVINFSF